MFKNSILTTCPNPFKICVIILHLLLNISRRHISLGITVENLKENIIKIWNRFLNVDESINEVNRYLKDKCYNRNKVIDILSHNELSEIMLHPNIEINIK